jgi:hypothetical protein
VVLDVVMDAQPSKPEIGKYDWIERRQCRGYFASIMRPVLRELNIPDRKVAMLMRALGHPMSASYVSRVMSGKRVLNPQTVNKFCELLRADAGARHKLHRAAALDYGYDIGSIEGRAED